MAEVSGGEPPRPSLAERATAAAYRAGWVGVRRMPERAAERLFATGADVAWRRHGRSVERLEANLRRVRPDLDQVGLRALSRAGMRSYLRYWCEAFRLPSMDADQVRGHFVMESADRLDELMGQGNGVVAALSHSGNWDLAGAWATGAGHPVVTVAERLRPEDLFDRFLAYRESLGMEVLPLTGAPHGVFPVLARRLREGRLVPLLADRDLTARGVPVTFFGEATRMPAGPAVLSLQTGAPLVPFLSWYDGPVCRGRLGEVVPVPDGLPRAEQVAVMTQQVADAFEAHIRAHPQDWHMLQRLWLADLDQARLAASDAAGVG